MSDQKSRLDNHYDTYRRDSRQDDLMRELVVQTFEGYLNATGRGLELGCSDGYMSEMLSSRMASLDVIEGSTRFIEEARGRQLQNTRFHHQLFEDYQPDRPFDYVFASYILTHIEEPARLFAMIRRALASDGLLFVVVPNARAISRQLALHMGLIDDLKGLTPNDLDHGHCRTFDRVDLNRMLAAHGFNAIDQGGIMLKPLADFQVDALYRNQMLNRSHVEGMYRLGREYPDLCSAIYCVCQLAGSN